MPRTAIVGLDGSPESHAAAEWAAREAKLRGLPLKLVNVRGPVPAPLAWTNASTNVTATWVLARALDLVRSLPKARRDEQHSVSNPRQNLPTAAARRMTSAPGKARRTRWPGPFGSGQGPTAPATRPHDSARVRTSRKRPGQEA